MANFIKSWQFMAIIIGVLVLAAGGGVIYGVTTHTEAGFDPDFNFIPGERTAGRETLPLDVCVGSYDPSHDGNPNYRPPGGGDANGIQRASEHDLAAVTSAAGVINTRVGGVPLLHVESIATGRCLILVNVGVPEDSSWDDAPGGRAWRCGNGCCIETSNTGTDEVLDLALQHELGHCLGLGHDNYESSIMYPAVHPVSSGFPPRLSDSDRTLLDQTYHQR